MSDCPVGDCEYCQKRKCNKIYRIPVGSGAKRRIFRVCGRCVMHDAKRLRAWLDAKEGELA